MAAANAAGVPWLRLAVSLVIGGALVVLVWPLMAAVPSDPSIAPLVLVGFAGLLVPYHGLRALRWWFLLRRVGEVPWRSAITIGLVGYMWIALLPLRLGELVRPALVAQRHGVALGRTLAVVALERITDGFVVAALFFATARLHPRPDDDALARQVQTAATISSGLFAAVLVGLVVLARWPGPWRAMLRLFARGRLGPLVHRVDGMLAQIAEGARALSRGGGWPAFALTTAAYWATNIAALWWLARGCGVPLSLASAALVTAVMNLALALPGGPAQVGVFQGGIAVGLLLVVPRATVHAGGSLLAFWLYACQLGSIVAVGLWAQRRLRLRWHELLRDLSPRDDGA